MPEMAHASKYHGYAAFVSSINHFLVAHGAAWLYDAGGAVVDDYVQSVAEGEEGITGYGGACQRECGVFGFDAGNAGRVQAAHLPCAYAHCHAVFAKDDGVAFNEFGHFPGK